MSLWKRVLPVVLVAVLFAMTAVPTFAIKPEERTSIIDVALDVNAATGSFDVLIGAVLAADEAIFNTLDGNGQFTVFAPTDAAFEALFRLPESDILAYLTSIEDGSEAQANLTGILLYHVARGNREAAEVLSSDQIRMLSGDFTYISIQEDMPYINQAQIIIPDVTMPDNGVIHAIDAVLIP